MIDPYWWPVTLVRSFEGRQLFEFDNSFARSGKFSRGRKYRFGCPGGPVSIAGGGIKILGRKPMVIGWKSQVLWGSASPYI